MNFSASAKHDIRLIICVALFIFMIVDIGVSSAPVPPTTIVI